MLVYFFVTTVFDYNLTVDESRTNAGLYPRAAFDGQQNATKGNVTLTLGSKSCVNSILELVSAALLLSTVYCFSGNLPSCIEKQFSCR
jgi:hypothetical protein